jgi:hypothetical protein
MIHAAHFVKDDKLLSLETTKKIVADCREGCICRLKFKNKQNPLLRTGSGCGAKWNPQTLYYLGLQEPRKYGDTLQRLILKTGVLALLWCITMESSTSFHS